MLTPFPVWCPPRWNSRVEGLILRRAKHVQLKIGAMFSRPPLFFYMPSARHVLCRFTRTTLECCMHACTFVFVVAMDRCMVLFHRAPLGGSAGIQGPGLWSQGYFFAACAVRKSSRAFWIIDCCWLLSARCLLSSRRAAAASFNWSWNACII